MLGMSRLFPERWLEEPSRGFKTLLWVCAVLAVAAYGSVCVRNVTTMLADMAYHPAVVAMATPGR